MVEFFYYYDHVPLNVLTYSVSELTQVASISIMILFHVRACGLVKVQVTIDPVVSSKLTNINLKRCHCVADAR